MRVSTLSEDKKGKAGEALKEIQTAFENLSTSNFKGRVIAVEIPSGEEVKVPHNLKKVPLGYLVLRHRGLGLITDGDAAWTDKFITLKNTPVTISGGGSFSSNVAVVGQSDIQAYGSETPGNGTTDSQIKVLASGLNSSFSGSGGSTNVTESVKLLIWILGG